LAEKASKCPGFIPNQDVIKYLAIDNTKLLLEDKKLPPAISLDGTFYKSSDCTNEGPAQCKQCRDCLSRLRHRVNEFISKMDNKELPWAKGCTTFEMMKQQNLQTLQLLKDAGLSKEKMRNEEKVPH
jgi:hypothetical protein